ncbi:MAG: apolipoprotein N-acyltransferase [Chitinophagaceae bacterium]|jgi:apolipoprotein N-acyltransferase|nr:apolipoprotein N-acyltransferase [Chitinophagaceae bacterium]
MPYNFNSKFNLRLLAFLSAIPLTLFIQMVDTPLNWFAFILAFYPVEFKMKDALINAVIIGLTTAIVNFIWIISGTNRFTGSSNLLMGIGIILVFCIFFCFYTCLMGATYVLLQWKRRTKFRWLWTSIMAGCYFVLMDAFTQWVGKGFSTCMYVNYIPFATNFYAIQPASILGPSIISFVLGMVNYQAGFFLFYKKWKMLFIPVGIVFLYLFSGYIIGQQFEKKTQTLSQTPPVSVSIIVENISPDRIWNNQTGPFFVNNLMQMNKTALASKPQLVVWSETAVPWTYLPDDPFLDSVVQMNKPTGSTLIIGINTKIKGRTFYNSLYSIDTNRNVLGIYKKREALFLVEKPFMGIVLPFLTPNSFRVQEAKEVNNIATKHGSAGVLLCNESSITGLASQSVKAGAEFLINPGNDGWFSDTYITKQHFYHSRLRAVENRKDIIVNNNNGYCGIIEASGKVQSVKADDTSFVLQGTIKPNKILTFYTLYPNFLFYSCIIIFVIFTIINFAVAKMKRNI